MRHPCGNVPLSTLSVMMHYCHHHQAWFARIERWTQDGDDPVVVASASIDFGPFDRLDEVLAWLAESSRAALDAPGLPWVP